MQVPSNYYHCLCVPQLFVSPYSLPFGNFESYSLPIPKEHSYEGRQERILMSMPIQNSFPLQLKSLPKEESGQSQNVIIPIQSIPRVKKNVWNNSCCNVPLETNKPPNTNAIPNSFHISSYKSRNVFKSIIRHMHACVLNKKEEYVVKLEKKGFLRETIERAVNRISGFKAAERKNGKRKTGMNMIKQAIKVRSVFTYILKDALDSMFTNWNAKILGKMAERNLKVYKTVCGNYSKSIEKLLNEVKS